jgi:hypothetical protein
MKTRNWTHCLLGSALVLGTIGVQAAPVVYTLQTVGDGKLGSYAPFAEAVITIVQVSDTSRVVATPSGSGTLFVNKAGHARVTIVQNGKSVTANFEPGQIYVFYDTGKGIAGFGSAISPTYPVALDCNNTVNNGTPYTVDCQDGNAVNFLGSACATLFCWGDRDGTLSALFLGSTEFTLQTLALPKTLAQSTLLTGHAHMCAVTYTIGNPANTFEDVGNLGTCGGPAPTGQTLMTDHGGFSLQDMVGGSNPGVGPFGWGGWDTSNVGYLWVSVGEIDD